MRWWSNAIWCIASPVLAAQLAACSGGERAGTAVEGEECRRTAECREPLVCCGAPDGTCSATLDCIEAGTIPYQDGGLDAAAAGGGG